MAEGKITGPVGLFDGRSVACREPWEAPDILKGPDNHLDTLSLPAFTTLLSLLPQLKQQRTQVHF